MLHAEFPEFHAGVPLETKSKTPTFYLDVCTGGEIPIGPYKDAFVFNNGFGPVMPVEVHGTIPLNDRFTIGTIAGFAFQGIGREENHVLLESYRYFGVLGPAYITELFPWLTLHLHSGIGYGWYMVKGYDAPSLSGGSMATSIGAQCIASLGKQFGIGLGAYHRYYWGFYQAVSVSLALEYKFGMGDGTLYRKITAPFRPSLLNSESRKPVGPVSELRNLRIMEPVFEPVFPVLYKYYEDVAFGTLHIENVSNRTVKNINISLFVHGCMDTWRPVTETFSLEKKESRDIELKVLFNDSIMDITEATKVTAEIEVTCEERGKEYSTQLPYSLRILDRNALSWDDDRRVAAFITAKDPAVLRFSKLAAGVSTDTVSEAVDENLRKAMGIYSLLRQLEVKYVIDPRTPYTEFSEQTGAVDFLQFPSQTLEYRGGDCDDLCTLYTALLESTGVDTAFITVPGHILPAFRLTLSAEKARKVFPRSDNLIFIDDNVWIPVEITAPQDSFVEAWRKGAGQWIENSELSQAELYPTSEAWKEYEPVGFNDSPAADIEVDIASLKNVFDSELQRCIHELIGADLEALKQRIRESGGSPVLENKLGVLYARFGLLREAEQHFKNAVKKAEAFSTLINLGNIFFIGRQFNEALSYYQRAAEMKPDHPTVLLATARVHHELENYGSAGKAYDRLSIVNPALAREYSYLELRVAGSSRAGTENRNKGDLIWEE